MQSSSTSSGQHRINYTYNVDSCATFITAGLPQLYDSAGTGWGKITLNLSAINTVNNTNKLMLRILFSAPNTGSSGNTRFDNIAVEGDSLATITTGLNQPNIPNNDVKLYPNPTDGIIHLQMEAYYSGRKTFLVTNLIGETLLSFNTDADDISIDSSSITKGLYFITIITKNSKNKNTIKFIKN